MIKKYLVAICVIFCSVVPCYASSTLTPNAGSSILMDYSTGMVLAMHNETEKMFPASTTKIMTMILLFEAINDGRLSFEDTVTTSAYASSMGGSQVYLETGETMSVFEMFKSIAIASANDASVAIGEKIGGSIESFVEMMNTKSMELGLINTNFVNATGLHDDNHYTCAYDLALMAKYLIEIGQDELFSVTSLYDSYIREDSGEKFWLVNTNKLLKLYDGVDGLKTGYTKEAGYCLVSTVERDGVRLIGVVLKESEPTVRNSEMCAMLDYGFMNYKKEVLYQENEVVGSLLVKSSPTIEVSVIVKEEVSLLLEASKDVSIHSTIRYVVDEPPISMEEPVGVLEIFIDNDIVKEVDVYSSVAVEKKTVLHLTWEQFKRFL